MSYMALKEGITAEVHIPYTEKGEIHYDEYVEVKLVGIDAEGKPFLLWLTKKELNSLIEFIGQCEKS